MDRRQHRDALNLLMALVISMVVADCRQVPPAPVAAAGQTQCQAACARLASLHCSEADPVHTGTACTIDADCLSVSGQHDPHQACSAGACTVSCISFCDLTVEAGVALDPGCVANVTACDQVNSCRPSGPGTTCSGSACKVAPQ